MPNAIPDTILERPPPHLPPLTSAPTRTKDAHNDPKGGVRPNGWTWVRLADPRIPFALILTTYAVLGFAFLGFNRSPGQMFAIVASGCLLDMGLAWLLRRQRLVPLSAYITSCSLALLLNYAHASWLLFLPVYLAIGSKYVLTFEKRHVFNPSMFGVAASLLLTHELITAAPAYQWAGGRLTMSLFVVTAALALFIFRVGRTALIVSFLVFYTLQTALRAYLLRYHLPPVSLFVGTLSTPAFYIFTFYMITDPATSPRSARGQVLLAFALTVVDLALHLKESVFTFFYAALTVATVRFFFLHAREVVRVGPRAYGAARIDGQLGARLGVVGGLGVAGVLAYRLFLSGPGAGSLTPVSFHMTDLPAASIGLGVRMSHVLDEVDPRVAHIAKWLLSVGDAVAVGDVDGDGRPDLFFSNPLKVPGDRAAVYRNLGGMRFERMPLPGLDGAFADPKRTGLPAGGTFVDWDGDGDLDLCVPVGFGRTRLFENRRIPDGQVDFVDVTARLGVDEHTVSLAATFFDADRDGRLDLLITNALAPMLPDYDRPTPLNVFALPPEQYPNDRRMFHFMHNGWHSADNGGPHAFYRGVAGGRFEKADARALGLGATHWSISVATGDLDRDGFTDLYIANDFGPDELYLNEAGRSFSRIRGTFFGDVGRDTYKGMNSSLADFDRNGYLDVYVSDNHHALQSEGSLLWMTRPGRGPHGVTFSDEATRRNALNEQRWGWGAAAGDLDADGWTDIVQANGMLDDRLDRRIPDGQRKDYWYVNQKLMQAGPEIHGYADRWGDLRGREIYPNEARRVYLNRGGAGAGYFVDVAAQVGLAHPECSRGVALADLDDDGDLDVVVTNQFGSPSIYRNDPDPGTAARRSFIGLALQGNGRTTHRSAIGTQVTVRTPESRGFAEQLQEVSLLGGFSGQGDPRLFFGLGGYRGEVEVTIRWYGGTAETRRLAADRYHTLVQP